MRQAMRSETPNAVRSPQRPKPKPRVWSGAMVMNPVLWREWRGRWRRPITPIAVTFYAALLALAAWYAYPEQQNLEDRQTTIATMQTLLRTLSAWQIVMASLLAATMAASSVVSEKERGLWTMLRLSPLSPSQIVQGKMMASFAFIALLIFVPLPMSVTLLLIGGVSGIECVLVLLLQLVTAMLCGALALTISARSRSVAGAMGLALPCAAAILVFPLVTLANLGLKGFPFCAVLSIVISTFCILGLIFGSAPAAIAREILGNGWGEERRHAHSLLPRHDEMPPLILLPVEQSSVPIHLATARTETPSHAAITAASVREGIEVSSIRQTQRIPSKAPERESTMAELDLLRLHDPKRQALVAKEHAAALARAHNVDGPVGRWLRFDNPVLQRAARHHFRFWCGLSAGDLGFFGSLIFLVWAAAVSALAAMYSDQMKNSYHSDTFWTWCAVALLWIGFSTVKVAALSFAGDRAQGMLKPLLMTRLTPRDIVWGKLAAALLAGLAPAILFVPIAGFALGVAPLETLAVLLVAAAGVWLCATCGVLCSWLCESTAIAIIATGALLFACAMTPSQLEESHSIVGRFLQGSAIWPQLQLWLHPQTPQSWLQLGLVTSLIVFALGVLALIPVVRALRPAALEKDKKNVFTTDLSKAF